MEQLFWCPNCETMASSASNERDAAKIEKLNGSNYQTWKYNMKLILMERGLWGFIDGREVRPNMASMLKTYIANLEKTYSLIALAVQPSLQIHIVNTTDPKEAWEILADQFSFVSVTEIVRLTRKFYAATMQEGDDLMKHITQMTSYAQQLRELDEAISSKKFATVVLGSLPPSYDIFITSLNARRAEDLDWSSLRGSLTEEYIKRKEKKSERGPAQRDDALLVRGNGRNHLQRNNSNNHRDNPCYNCGIFGHIGRNCPADHYNNNNGNNNRSNNNNNNNNNNYNNNRNNNNNNNNNNNSGMNNNGMNNNRRVSFQDRPGNNGISNNSFRRGGEQGNFCSAFQDQLSIHDDLALMTSNFSDSNDNSADDWFIDSAASRHMTYDRSSLSDFVEETSNVFLGDDMNLPAVGRGNVIIPVYENSKVTNLKLQNVLYVPGLKKNLVSVGAMVLNKDDDNDKAVVYFDDEKCVVSKGGKNYTIGHFIGNKLYKLNNRREYASIAKTSSAELWHQRLGHLNYDSVDRLAKGEIATGMRSKQVTPEETVKVCEPCALGKMHRESFPKQSNTKSTKVLELIHTDLCGPMEIESMGGSKYFLTFTDDYSRYSEVYFLKSKDEVFGKFQEYVLRVEKLQEEVLKTVRSDNGGEYTSNEFLSYCKQMTGIRHEFTNPYTPEQNGVSERYNRTVMEAARSMLYNANLPLSFWAEAVKCATYVRNRSPTSALGNKTPYECWFGKKPDISNLRAFGCIAYVHVPDQKRTKLQPKSQKCVFTGPDDTKGYKLFNIETGKFVRSRNVLFSEAEFHDFDTKTESTQWISLFPIDEIEIIEDLPDSIDDSREVEWKRMSNDSSAIESDSETDYTDTQDVRRKVPERILLQDCR